MSEEFDSIVEPFWEVVAGEQGTEVTQSCDDIEEVLDFCGRALYGNAIFRVMLLQIRHAHAAGKMDGWQEPIKDGEYFNWTLKPMRRGKVRPTRYFSTTHDLFGMILAELRQGTDHIEVCGRYERQF